MALAAPSAVAAQAASTPPPVSYVVVLAAGLNVRDAPSLDARVSRVVTRGDTLCALRFEGDWAEVRTPVREPGGAARARSGFVSRGFVSETRAGAETLRSMGCG